MPHTGWIQEPVHNHQTQNQRVRTSLKSRAIQCTEKTSAGQWFIHLGTVQFQDNNIIFCQIVPNPFKEILCGYWIQEPNMMHMIILGCVC